MAQVNAVQSFIAKCNQTPEIFELFANRITANNLPDNQPIPCARVREITSQQMYHHGGEGGRFVLLQVDVYSDTPGNANTASETIRSAFSGYKGMIGSLVAGMCKATIVYSNRDPETLRHVRIVEVEIPTND